MTEQPLFDVPVAEVVAVERTAAPTVQAVTVLCPGCDDSHHHQLRLGWTSGREVRAAGCDPSLAYLIGRPT